MIDPKDGREAQFEAMMEALSSLQAKYRGVRGALLEKVREEFLRLKPGASAVASPGPTPAPVQAAPVAPPVQLPRAVPANVANMMPSCRTCGRSMKANDVGDALICERGHTRSLLAKPA